MKEIKCLDHGFVKVLNISGSVRRLFSNEDEKQFQEVPETRPTNSDYVEQRLDTFRQFDADTTDIARSARICFDNFEEERTREQDLKLVDYLIRNHHTSPIEMIETWWEMKLPIFLARQFIRHRTATVNETSARYSILPEEWYIPEVVGGKSISNKQGQEDNLSEDSQLVFKTILNEQCINSYGHYKTALSLDVAPEHARLFLHVNHYTHWIWKQDLHNLFHFLALRLHEHAQIEARVYAQAIYNILKVYLPEVMEMFDKYRRL